MCGIYRVSHHLDLVVQVCTIGKMQNKVFQAGEPADNFTSLLKCLAEQITKCWICVHNSTLEDGLGYAIFKQRVYCLKCQQDLHSLNYLNIRVYWFISTSILNTAINIINHYNCDFVTQLLKHIIINVLRPRVESFVHIVFFKCSIIFCILCFRPKVTWSIYSCLSFSELDQAKNRHEFPECYYNWKAIFICKTILKRYVIFGAFL